MALLAWRLVAGTISMREAGETTTILGWPLWHAYAAMVPGVALTALLGFSQRARRRCARHAMSPLLVGALLFGAMLVLMAVRVPIAIAMFVPGAIGYMVLSGDAAAARRTSRARSTRASRSTTCR